MKKNDNTPTNNDLRKGLSVVLADNSHISNETSPELSEERGSVAVLSFGRMNPITSGHQKLVDKINTEAKKRKAKAMLFISHSQDKKKNPLSYADKLKFAKKAFGNIVQKSNAKTIIEVLKMLDGKYSTVVIVVGSDRVKEFSDLINRYNGKDYTYNNIEIVSAGERDPDADDVSGMSASKIRSLAVAGKFKEFKSGLPSKLTDRDAKEMYDVVRTNMGITEDLTLQEVLSIQQRMRRKIIMRRLKSKIKIGRFRAQRKLASDDKLKVRSKRKARNILRKRMLGQTGKQYQDLNISSKIAIDRRLEKRKTAISKIAKRLLPKVRVADKERLRSFKKNQTLKNSIEQDYEYLELINEMFCQIEIENISEAIERNLIKKSEKYGVSLSELKQRYANLKNSHLTTEDDTLTEQSIFNAMNVDLANEQKNQIEEALEYHLTNKIPLTENVFRVGSINYYKLFSEAKKAFAKNTIQFEDYDIGILRTDIGEFAQYNEEWVPLDCPLMEEEEEEKKELNKPKRGGPKKFYVFVKDPSSGNVKKVTFGDTTGLSVKFSDDNARKSFVARHKCSTQNDKTSAAYWSCRLPKYAKQLGLSGGGNFFW
jgi:nicotinic acid mononucleotide adenylyltransferase